MTLKPEIRGLWQIALRAYDERNFESALHYFSLALRRYVRHRMERHHNILYDPIVLILTMNCCVVLCQLRHFNESFELLTACGLTSIDNSELLIILPLQLVPLLAKLVSLAYLYEAQPDMDVLAVRYLSLIRQHFFPLLCRQISNEEAAFIFLSEATLNLQTSEREACSTFQSALHVFQQRPFAPNFKTTKLALSFSSVMLKLCGESVEIAGTITKEQLEFLKRNTNTLDFICLLIIIGVAHSASGRTLLAIEALEKGYSLLKSDQIEPIITPSANHKYLQLFIETCISNNLSVAYHMLDLKKESCYRQYWEKLALQSFNLMDGIFIESERIVQPVFWMMRYLNLFNQNAHLSLCGEFQLAQRGFYALYSKELTTVIDHCKKFPWFCGISYIPDLTLELLEVIAMLLAAVDNFDESWRTFQSCFDELNKAGGNITDENIKQAYLMTCYTRIVDKIDRCHPLSKTNKELTEIRRLRFRTSLMSAPSLAQVIFSSRSGLVIDDEKPKESESVPADTQPTPKGHDGIDDNDDHGFLIREMQKTLQMEELSSPGQQRGRRKKHRNLAERVLSSKASMAVKSPYLSVTKIRSSSAYSESPHRRKLRSSLNLSKSYF